MAAPDLQLGYSVEVGGDGGGEAVVGAEQQRSQQEVLVQIADLKGQIAELKGHLGGITKAESDYW